MTHLDKSQLTLAEWRGNTVLLSPQFAQWQDENVQTSSPLHITLLTKEEKRTLGSPDLGDVDLEHVYLLGPGANRSGTVRWVVAIWNHGNLYRKKLKLPPKDFHITLTDQDEHNIDKGITSLVGGLEALSSLLEGLDESALDHILASKQTPFHPQLASQMVLRYPDSYKSYIRLGDCTIHEQPKVAMLSYARALQLNPAVHDYAVKRVSSLSHRVLWGPALTRSEHEALTVEGLLDALQKPWSSELKTLCQHQLWTCPTETRERVVYMGRQLPRFFTWLYPHRLAGMSTPTCEADIDILMDMGLTTVLTLTAEEPLPEAWFAFKPIRNIFIPVENYGAPTLAEMDIIYESFMEDNDGAWLVHCGGGKGRAGSVLTCLMAVGGYGTEDNTISNPTPRMDKTTAIEQLRAMRPGSIESEKQEHFIGEWISHRWSVASVSSPSENLDTPLCTVINNSQFPRGLNHSVVKACFLVGLPGSGKSWLAQSIAKRRSAPTIVISQDESRSRQSCERILGRNYSDDTLLILDRCNPDIKGRREWLSLTKSDHGSVAIFFDYDKEVCKARIDRRLGHPTIRPGRGKNAMQQMSADLEAPSLTEGFGAILTVSSFSASREAVYLLSGPAPIIKFPRTPHLIDLGATTSDDLVAPVEELTGRLVVEEKIDGANMGFSLDWHGSIICQNRSHYVSSSEHSQFKPLDAWIDFHREALFKILHRDPQNPERFILYGEWVVARHSIGYTALPDRFLAFDLYDRLEDAFISRRLLESALRGSDIAIVPLIVKASRLTHEKMIELVQRQSQFYEGRVEGIYVRVENEEGTGTVRRGKVVRSDFLAGNEHWTKGPLVLNGFKDDLTS